jgi:hypothetical protein
VESTYRRIRKRRRKTWHIFFFILNPGQTINLLQLKLVGILTINLFLTKYSTSVIKNKIHPLNQFSNV